MAAWDFSKLPEKEFKNIPFLLEIKDVPALIEIHNEYNLSSFQYCCVGAKDRDGVLAWFQWAIDNGIITDN